MGFDNKLDTLIKEYFEDENVQFPEKPELVTGIRIYSHPKGLGLQFLGGAKKLVIRGVHALEIWERLNPHLNGENSINKIIKVGTDNQLDVIDTMNFLKILHSHHLLRKTSDDNGGYDDNLQYLSWNASFYNRVIGLTGANESVHEVFEKINGTKILIICSVDFVVPTIYNFLLNGFTHLGLFYFGKKQGDLYRVPDDITLMTNTDISSLKLSEVKNKLYSKIDDYNYVVSAINNPSYSLIKDISSLCFTKDKPFLSISLKENIYKIGPLFVPNVSACINCLTLRKQSYDRQSQYDYIYENFLEVNDFKNDRDIEGFDTTSFNIAVNKGIFGLRGFITNISSSLFINKFIEFDSVNGASDEGSIIPVPGCMVCSNNTVI